MSVSVCVCGGGGGVRACVIPRSFAFRKLLTGFSFSASN